MTLKPLGLAQSALSHRLFKGRLPQWRPDAAINGLMRLLDRARQRDDLLELTDDHLSDIGLTRREAEREAGKWFWE